MPRLYINRRTAMEHRCDPAHDPDFKNSIFSQIYEALKPRDSNTKCLDYRYGHPTLWKRENLTDVYKMNSST
jgi:E3 ubiquitin-protein ligase HECTD3